MGADTTPDPLEEYPDRHVTAVKDEHTGIVELAVAGRWDQRLSADAERAWRECLAGHPAGLLLDLSYLEDPDGLSAGRWLAAAEQGSRLRPSVPVAACLRPGTPLVARLTGHRCLPVHLDLQHAHRALDGSRPPAEQVRLALPPGATSPATARRVVTEACLRWTLESLIPRARLVASELVANACEHAGTTIDLAVTRLGPEPPVGSAPPHYLHLAVYDRSPVLPPAPPGDTPDPVELTARGLGLRVVVQAASAWGTLPTRSGKVVWATIRPA